MPRAGRSLDCGWRSMLSDLPWLHDSGSRLAQILSSQRLPAGLLLYGPRGLGRHRLACAVAQIRFCRHPGSGLKSCEECPACMQVRAGSHPDLLQVRPEAENSAIKIESIRDLSRRLALSSGSSGARIAIISPAERLSIAAANALLKTLEEPSPGVTLILVSNASGGLPATVLSRCQRVRVSPPSTESALRWLNQRQERTDWSIWLTLAGGAPLGALTLARTLPDDVSALLDSLIQVVNGRRDPLQFASQAAEWPLEQLIGLITWLLRVATRAWVHAPLPDSVWTRQIAQASHLADGRRLVRAWQEAHGLLAEIQGLNPALARERLILLTMQAFRSAR